MIDESDPHHVMHVPSLRAGETLTLRRHHQCRTAAVAFAWKGVERELMSLEALGVSVRVKPPVVVAPECVVEAAS